MPFRFEVLKRTLIYKITESGELLYSRVTRVRALQDDLDDFVDRFYWTGGSDIRPYPGKNVAQVLHVEGRGGMYDYYSARFARALKKGDELEFEVCWPAIADWRAARPYVAASTEEPTREITFQVTIPRRLRQTDQAWCEVLRSAESRIPFETLDKTFRDDGQVTWTISKPRLYRGFRLRWLWGQGSPSQPGEVVPAPRTATLAETETVQTATN